jgi:hypothetical protein
MLMVLAHNQVVGSHYVFHPAHAHTTNLLFSSEKRAHVCIIMVGILISMSLSEFHHRFLCSIAPSSLVSSKNDFLKTSPPVGLVLFLELILYWAPILVGYIALLASFILARFCYRILLLPQPDRKLGSSSKPSTCLLLGLTRRALSNSNIVFKKDMLLYTVSGIFLYILQERKHEYVIFYEPHITFLSSFYFILNCCIPLH